MWRTMQIADQSPEDDEDELMFPELVDRCSKQAMEDQYMEDIAFGARFDETDDEEKNENDDSLVLADYEGEDLPTIEWNRENPQLAKGTVFQTMMDCRNAITTYHILTKNNYEVIKSEPGFVKMELIRLLEWKIGAENAEENEAAIQLEIEAAVQHEEIEAANAEEIEAAVQHEEIEAANAEEIEAAVQHEEIEPMDREQREQMDVEWLQPMSPEESQQYYRHCLDSCKAMCDAHFEELMAEEKAEASQKKKNKKEGKRKVDTGNIPGRVTRNLLNDEEHQDGAVPMVIDATNIEAIAYNIASTAQTHCCLTSGARVRIDAKTIEAIVYNRAAKPPIQPSADPLVKYTKMFRHWGRGRQKRRSYQAMPIGARNKSRSSWAADFPAVGTMRADETSAGAVVDVQRRSSSDAAGGQSRRRDEAPAMAAPADGGERAASASPV
ncbi:hypothetical protein QYE76_070231 [Lolium multiflorum]|uniref:Uncharacterized protein n=1 Tax=Lolium multiflorum TaxID=4521 RepID=A0AAD8WDG0_LOLMU|nr:hypothetical protein QYE76_070231 [Lolium multiflorum]